MTAAPKQGMVSTKGERMMRKVPATFRLVTRGTMRAALPGSSTQMAMLASPAHLEAHLLHAPGVISACHQDPAGTGLGTVVTFACGRHAATSQNSDGQCARK